MSTHNQDQIYRKIVQGANTWKAPDLVSWWEQKTNQHWRHTLLTSPHTMRTRYERINGERGDGGSFSGKKESSSSKSIFVSMDNPELLLLYNNSRPNLQSRPPNNWQMNKRWIDQPLSNVVMSSRTWSHVHLSSIHLSCTWGLEASILWLAKNGQSSNYIRCTMYVNISKWRFKGLIFQIFEWEVLFKTLPGGTGCMVRCSVGRLWNKVIILEHLISYRYKHLDIDSHPFIHPHAAKATQWSSSTSYMYRITLGLTWTKSMVTGLNIHIMGNESSSFLHSRFWIFKLNSLWISLLM